MSYYYANELFKPPTAVQYILYIGYDFPLIMIFCSIFPASSIFLCCTCIQAMSLSTFLMTFIWSWYLLLISSSNPPSASVIHWTSQRTNLMLYPSHSFLLVVSIWIKARFRKRTRSDQNQEMLVIVMCIHTKLTFSNACRAWPTMVTSPFAMKSDKSRMQPCDTKALICAADLPSDNLHNAWAASFWVGT